MNDPFPIYLLGAVVAMFCAAFCFSVSRGTIRLPEWLFPVRGRWLRCLFAGAGVVLLVISAPLWACIVVPLMAALLVALIPFALITGGMELVVGLLWPIRQPAANPLSQSGIGAPVSDERSLPADANTTAAPDADRGSFAVGAPSFPAEGGDR